MRIKVVLVFMFFTIFNLTSEILQTDRLELKYSSWVKNKLIPLKKDGFLIVRVNKSRNKKIKKNTIIAKYDTNFTRIWKKGYLFDRKLSFEDSCTTDDEIILFFRNKRNGKFILLSFEKNTGKERRIDGKLLPKAVLQDFQYSNNKIYYLALTQQILVVKQKITLSTINIFDGSLKTTFVSDRKKELIDSFRIDEKNQTASLSLIDKVGKKVSISFFDQNTDLIKTINYPQKDDNKTFVTAKIHHLNSDKTILMGSYSVKFSPYTTGIYVAQLDKNYSIIDVKYYNFNTFNNYFAYLSEKGQEKMERKRERKKKWGKEFKIQNQFLDHDLIIKDNQFIWIAEGYYPTYTSQTCTTSGGSCGTTTFSVLVFDGWLYTHAVAAAFNFDGEKLWDASIKIGDFKTYELHEIVKVSMNKNNIALLYVVGKAIRLTEIKNGKIVTDKAKVNLETLTENEEIKGFSRSEIDLWYDNYYICWGDQKVKDLDKKIKSKKRVFFVNKISVTE